MALRNRNLLFVFTCLLAGSVQAQLFKENSYVDLAVSGANGRLSTSLQGYRLHGIGSKKKIKIGYGLRFTNFVGANRYYTTAPARFTSPIQNIGTLFSETYLENIDTIATATAVTNSLNVAIHFQYDFNSQLSAGFNIDAVGLSFGPEKKFNVISSIYDPNQAPVQAGSPTRLNVLLTSDNDIGSLNSEFYLRYAFAGRWGIRVGFTFLFSEYRTHKELSFDNGRIVNDRYRYKASMALVGVGYRIFK
jgi:hypothetical protein